MRGAAYPDHRAYQSVREIEQRLVKDHPEFF